jgi:arylsulfatase A-like enzyme
MARNGMRFTQFYAGSTVCAPSRSALMTGLHTGHTPIRGNKSTEPEGQWPLPDSSVTIAEMLKGAGYVTGDFGKWGLGFVGTSGDPLRQGFDRFFGYNCQSLAHNFYPDHLWKNDQRIDYPNTPTNFAEYSGDIIHQQALGFIDENKDKPFFLFLSYTLPHAALQVPEDSIFERYKKEFKEPPQNVPATWSGKGYAPQAYPHAAYAAMVTRLDHYVGEVMTKLKAKGLDKNTLILFTSDNGPHQEGGNDPAFFNSNGGLRGIKRDVFEGGIRIPLIAYWPGKIKGGQVNDHVGAFWDLMPTFAGIANVKAPRDIDGISIAPVLLQQKGQKQHEYLYWEFHEQGGKQAVRKGKWKGVRLDVKKNPDGPIQLYDLEKDPYETTDVANQNPSIQKEIQKIMQDAHTPNPDFVLVNR